MQVRPVTSWPAGESVTFDDSRESLALGLAGYVDPVACRENVRLDLVALADFAAGLHAQLAQCAFRRDPGLVKMPSPGLIAPWCCASWARA